MICTYSYIVWDNLWSIYRMLYSRDMIAHPPPAMNEFPSRFYPNQGHTHHEHDGMMALGTILSKAFPYKTHRWTFSLSLSAVREKMSFLKLETFIRPSVHVIMLSCVLYAVVVDAPPFTLRQCTLVFMNVKTRKNISAVNFLEDITFEI